MEAKRPESPGSDTDNPSPPKDRLVLMEGSHTRWLAEALIGHDIEVVEVTAPGLIFTVEKVEAMGRRLHAILETEVCGNTMIVFQVLDNLCYQQGEDPDWRPLQKGRDVSR